ncbi:forkhead box protein P1-like isoform X2 [Physella acuta]|uniref:forkhead box protein P1-like isoform X2 n=1 Tax=Physella acuta TaxID=109671 RepID=UPI0027DC991D|nr:forkhead box protein P1-like isoform X2 [Physella acuta]
MDDGTMEDSQATNEGSLSHSDDGSINNNNGQHNNGQHINGQHNGNSSDCNDVDSRDSILPPNMALAKTNPVLCGAAKRKAKSIDSSAAQIQQQNLLMMVAQQQGQLQQSLQHPGLPRALQEMMQQHTMAMQQQQDYQTLSEQLQLNIMQQAQMIKDSSSGKGLKPSHSSQSFQTLLLQHQQLMQQMQLFQRPFALAASMLPHLGLHQGMMSPADIQQMWKDEPMASGLDDIKAVNGMSPATTCHSSNSYTNSYSNSYSNSNGLSSKRTSPSYHNGDMNVFNNIKSETNAVATNSSSSLSSSSKDHLSNGTSPSPTHPLYVNNCCKWPNCDAHITEFNEFIRHLNTEHQLDDRSTAQSRVQMEVVSSLESQLAFQKKVLKAMTDHLCQQTTAAPPQPSHPQPQPTTIPSPFSSSMSVTSSQLSPKSHDMKHNIAISSLMSKPSMINPFTGTFLPPVSMVPSPIMHRPPPMVSTPVTHHTSSSLPPTPSSGGGSSRGGGDGGGPVRRRVSDKCNLPISAEIQRNREFYKNTDVRPPFTYASLIRQAIIESPHRQLTLNEIYQWFQNTFAYFRRNEATWKNAIRTNLSLHRCFVRYEDDFGSFWMVDDFEYICRRQFSRGRPSSMKTPTMSDTSPYNETLIRAAMSDVGFMKHNLMPDQESAQDLSMKSSSHDPFGRFDEMMMIKQEVHENYSDLDLSTSQNMPSSRHHSPSPQHPDIHDPQGIEVKGGQMVMVPDLMDHYDSREDLDADEEEERRIEEERRMEEEERRLEEEERRMELAERDPQRHVERGESRYSEDDEHAETEAERELRAVQEKLEREQAEDMKRERSALTNGYRSRPDNGLQQGYGSMPFSPLNSSEHEHHFHSRATAEEVRSQDLGGVSQDSPFYSSGKQLQRSAETEEVEDMKAPSPTTRPFIVQLPDSGPVFPTPHRQPLLPSVSPVDAQMSSVM